MDITRIKKLAGLNEANQIEDPDEEDRRDDERRAREAKVTRAIGIAFKRIGSPVARIIYFEDEREAVVYLDEFEIDLDTLIKLKESGLAQRYEIHAGKDFELRIEFVAAAELDNVVLPPPPQRR